jgi:two-component system cell cycle response regulator
MNPADGKVLLVDDDPAILRLLSVWLNKAGFSVRCAADGEEALAAIEAECPDFLVVDWEMPKMNGLQLCQRVRRLSLPRYVYILFLTVKTAPDEMIEGLEAGADDFLGKPVHQGELLARLRAGARRLQLERQLSDMARTDPLTELLTQRTFYELRDKEWHRAERYHVPLSCVMVDIDFFKRVNDVYGHPAGDSILRMVAELLSDICRSSDVVSRYGGEEFCVMLPETGEPEAACWAERARKRLAALMIPIRDKIIHITGSFGVAQRYDDTQNAEALVDQADQALLCAKQSGRDRVVRYDSLGDVNELGLRGEDTREGLFYGVAARHVMNPMVACLREDDTVGQAAEFFLRSRINSTPVVDARGRLCGILSEKDIMAAMVSPDFWKHPVHELMKPNVICYDEDTPIRVIYEFLCRVSIRRVVITKDDCPIGTISRATLLRWFKNLVVSKGLLGRQTKSANENDQDPYRSWEHLVGTARELARQSAALHTCFQENVDDLMPHIVGGATRMQELVNDLLAYSRYADRSNELGGAMQAMLLDGGNVD